MPRKGDFGGFRPGFLLDGKKDKGKSPEAREKPGQLSTGDRHLALSRGINPGEYHERRSGQPEGSRVGQDAYETVLDHSMEPFPPDVLVIVRILNRRIAEGYAKSKLLQNEHLKKSKGESSGTARVAVSRAPEGQHKEALFLGFGNGFDIDLPRHAEMFDGITLVDLDRESPKRAIEQLPLETQKKIKLVIADVTGINGKLSTDFLKCIQDSGSKDQAIATLAKIIKNAERETTRSTPDLGTNYAFVCSHLISSQLANVAFLHVERLTELKFGEPLLSKLDSSANNLLKSHEELRDSLHKEHIRFLARLVAPFGTVHFADTYMDRSGGSHEGSMMVNPRVINPVLQENFKSIKGETSWVFDQHQHQQFLVVSHSLEHNTN